MAPLSRHRSIHLPVTRPPDKPFCCAPTRRRKAQVMMLSGGQPSKAVPEIPNTRACSRLRRYCIVSLVSIRSPNNSLQRLLWRSSVSDAGTTPCARRSRCMVHACVRSHQRIRVVVTGWTRHVPLHLERVCVRPRGDRLSSFMFHRAVKPTLLSALISHTWLGCPV